MDVTQVLMGCQAADPNVRVQAEQQLAAAKESNLVRIGLNQGVLAAR